MVIERMNEHAADGDGSPLIPRAIERVKNVDDKLVSFVNERPVVALCAALAVGYVVGRVLTHR
jgi:hypothetical protein